MENSKYGTVCQIMSLAILIVDYNGHKLTNNLLNSINRLKLPSKYKLDIFIVDNGSNEKYNCPLKDKNIHIIRTEINQGFGKGANLGLENILKKKFSKIMLLNNDVELNKTLIIDNINLIDRSEIVLFNTYCKNGELESSAFGHFNTLTSRGFKTPPSGKYDIAYFNFAAIVISSSILKLAGLFDSSNFYLYWEDVDLSLRLKKLQPRIEIGKSKIIHEASSTTKKFKYSTQMRYTESQILFFKKHKLSTLGIFTPILISIIRFFKYLFRLRFSDSFGVIVGLFAGIFSRLKE